MSSRRSVIGRITAQELNQRIRLFSGYSVKVPCTETQLLHGTAESYLQTHIETAAIPHTCRLKPTVLPMNAQRPNMQPPTFRL